MNIFELAMAHDIALLGLISMVTIYNVLVIQETQGQTFRNILGL